MVYVGFLRAVNVGGKGMVSMAALRESAQRLGLKNVRTIGQSGNIVFEASKSGSVLESGLEREIAKRFKLETLVMIRSAPELAKIVLANPFENEAAEDPGRLVVVFLKSESNSSRAQSLRSAIVGRERVALKGNVLYAVYPDGIGRSKLTAALIDKHLGTRGTARNWNTVCKLLAATQSSIAT